MSEQSGRVESTEDIVPPELQAYFDLNLSTEGVLANDLLSGVSGEAKRDEIPLEHILGQMPADITPHCASWFQSRIHPIRSNALQSLCGIYEMRTEAAHGAGFMPEARRAEIDEELLHGRLKCYKEQNEKNHSKAQKLAKLKADIANKQNEYNVIHAELGREAKPLRRYLYLAVLVLVLFGSEAAINLEAFEALPWATPAIAWGATILIGLAIGLAAHFHGTVLKQFDYWLGTSRDDTRRGPAFRMIGAGTAALIFALGFVYYARSAYFTSFMGSLGGFGQSPAHGGSFLWIVGGSLIGNIIVYLTGSMWAFIMHDSDPHYVDLREEIVKGTTEIDALARTMEKSRQREVERITALHKRKRDEVDMAAKRILAQHSLRWPQQMLARFRAKDAEVVGLLMAYRQKLIHEIEAGGKSPQFIAYCDDPHAETTPLKLSDYQHRPITLKYI